MNVLFSCRTPLKPAFASLCLVAALTTAHRAHATETSGALDVRMELESGCDLAMTGADQGTLDFGDTQSPAPLQASATTAQGQTTLLVVCTQDLNGQAGPTLTLDAGQHAYSNQRYLVGPQGERIAYALYSDQARRVPWTPNRPMHLSPSLSGRGGAATIHGVVPSLTDPAAGLYTDTVALTLSY